MLYHCLHIQIPEIIKADYETPFETQGNKEKVCFALEFCSYQIFLFIPPHLTIFFYQWDYSLLENA